MTDLPCSPKGTIYTELELSPETYHVRFTDSRTVFRYPPEPFIKKLKRFFGIKPKGSPFVKLEDLKMNYLPDKEIEITIEKGIPIPAWEPWRKPFKRMEIGDSFFVALIDWINLSLSPVEISNMTIRSDPEKVFITRKISDPVPGFRVWRIK